MLPVKEIETENIIQKIPKKIIEFIVKKKYIGKLSLPQAMGYIKGPCGDEMQFFLAIEDNKIIDLKFVTSGCFFTYACGTMTSDLAIGKPVCEALDISAAEVINKLQGLPKSNYHCAILSVSTFYKAVVNYWIKEARVELLGN